MTSKRMIEIIEDLAENEGKSPEAFLLGIAEQAESVRKERFNSFPPELRAEAADAEIIRRESRTEKRKARERQLFDEQIARFVADFPGVAPENVPEQVWRDVSDGIPLAYAYAYSVCKGGKTTDEINAENEARSIPVPSGRAEEPSFTESEVEKMTPAKIKSNFSKIINSMRKWKN